MRYLWIITLAVFFVAGCGTTRTTLPTASNRPATIEIRVAADRTLQINGQSTEASGVASALHSSGHPKDTPVVIRVDQTVPYRHVIQILEQVREEGFANVSFATR